MCTCACVDDGVSIPLPSQRTPCHGDSADDADESGAGSSGGGGGGLFAGFGLGSFGLGGDLLGDEEEDGEGEVEEGLSWMGGGGAEARYNVRHWQALYEALQQARAPRYYDEVRGRPL